MDLQSFFTIIESRLATDPLLDVVLGLLVVALIQTVVLSRRVTLLTRGSSGSLEATLVSLNTRSIEAEAKSLVVEKALNNLDERLSSAVRAVSVKRFDPFQNSGGQQSFATALLNEKGDGVVLSGIHSRDGVRVYAKDVTGFISERELSEEEQGAIADAKKKLQ